MRNYYFTAWESTQERLKNGTPTIYGWAKAKNIDHAEATIRSHGFVRDSITAYTKAERESGRFHPADRPCILI